MPRFGDNPAVDLSRGTRLDPYEVVGVPAVCLFFVLTFGPHSPASVVTALVLENLRAAVAER
jgi:hypothetical protein